MDKSKNINISLSTMKSTASVISSNGKDDISSILQLASASLSEIENNESLSVVSRGGGVSSSHSQNFSLGNTSGAAHITEKVTLVDERHIWLTKCIAQGFNMIEGENSQQAQQYVEGLLSSGTTLDRVNHFLRPYGPRGLFCLLEFPSSASGTEELRVVFDPAELGDTQIQKVIYFVRINPVELPVSRTPAGDLIVGQFGSHAIKSFGLMLMQIYGQMLPKMKFPGEFSEDDKRSFFSQLTKYSMTMVDVVQTIECRVNFKKVDPGVLRRCQKLQNGEVVQQQDLEYLDNEIAGQWLLSAGKELIFEDPTLHTLDDIGPDAALKHWRERLAHLNSLSEHFESAETHEIVRIWEKALPEKAEAWIRLEIRLRDCTQEANDNVKHLANLNKHFEVLYKGTPKQISEELKTIFEKLKMLRMMAKYLQKNENLTALLVKIINQIINRCKWYIKSNDHGCGAADGDDEAEIEPEKGQDSHTPAKRINKRPARTESGGMFSRASSVASKSNAGGFSHLQSNAGGFSRLQSTASGMPGMGPAIGRLTSAVKVEEEEKEVPKHDIWSQDCDSVIAKLQECMLLNHTCQLKYREVKNVETIDKNNSYKLDENHIFAKFVHFEQRLQKLDEFFKACRLFELLREQDDSTGVLNSICQAFFKVLEVVKGRSYDVLDISATIFDAEFENIRIVVAELEQQLQDFIHENFKYIESTDQALDLLSNMHALMQRDSLKKYLSAKYLNVFTNFANDLDSVSNIYETLKENPPMPRDAPPVAGRILWVRHLLKLIEVPMTKFRQNAALMICRDAKSIIRQYNETAQAFVAYEVLWEQAWQKAVQSARLGMNATVLVVHPEDGKLYVNFDTALLQVMREAKCMRPMGIHIPDLVLDMMNRESMLKKNAARLKFLIGEYDEIKQMIVPDLKDLLSISLASLDSTMRPELSLVTWSSIHIDEYIRQFLEAMTRTREIIAKTFDLYENRVVRNLSIICLTNLVRIPDTIVTTANFITAQGESIKRGAFLLDQKCLEIEAAVLDIIALVTKFDVESGTSATIKHGGQEVLSKVWTNIYSAVLSCFKNSFQKLKARIKSSYFSSLLSIQQPFFKVDIELLPPQVKASPNVDDVQQAINKTALAILKAMKITPWQSLAEAPRSKAFNISDKVLGSIEVVRGVLMLTGSIESTRKKVQEHMQKFYAHDFLWTLDKKEQVNRFLGTQPELPQFIERLSEYDKLEKEITQMDNITIVGPLCLSNELIKFSLVAQVGAWKFAYNKALMNNCAVQIESIVAFINQVKTRLDSKVRDLDEVRNISQTLQQVRLLETEVEQRFYSIEHCMKVATEFDYPMSEKEKETIAHVQSEWKVLQGYAQRASDRLHLTQENFKKDLVRALEMFAEEITMYHKEFTANGPAFEDISPKEGMQRLVKFQKSFEDKAKKLHAFRQGEELFGLPKTPFDEIDSIKKDIQQTSHLYTLYTNCMKILDDNKAMLFPNLGPSIQKMADEVKLLSEKIEKIPKERCLYKAHSEMTVAVLGFSELLPIFEDLVKPSLRQCHWREIMLVSDTILDINSPTFCVQDLINANLVKHRFKIQHISRTADEELAVDEKVEAISRQWHSTSLTFMNFKSFGPVLFDMLSLQQIVDAFEETQTVLNGLAASKYALPFKDSIDEQIQNFSEFLELIEIWRNVQHVWWYVCLVFSSEDVGKQLPQEAQRFHKVNQVYIELMNRAFTIRFVPLLHGMCEELRNTLTSIMESLEVCEKHLAGFLDSKRDHFPRLYYISDKVLLESLSKTSGLESIENGGVLSLFSNIKKLVFAHGSSKLQLIESVQSEEAEILEFAKHVQENSVEVLLTDIERAMKASLNVLTQNAIKSMVPNLMNLASLEIEKLSSQYPCQSCVLAIQCWFSTMCESAFSASDKSDMKHMKEVSHNLTLLTNQLARNMPAPLTRTVRAKYEALCIINMMNQDVVQKLIKDSVKDKNSWDWQRQLKFGSDEGNNLYLETGMYKSPYTYEFVGCKKRLVCTAQTNKCYLFMLHVIASKHCASIAGPSGSGKSETIEELGRMLGRFVLKFNCAAEVSYSSINNLIAGVTKTGTWVGFDEVSRLLPGLLSVMAQQLLSVLNIQRDVQRDGRGILSHRAPQSKGLVESASGIFCCTNMEVSTERARLPDNLRSCVRVLAVTEPDVEVVAYVKLFLASFVQAEVIAAKISSVYKTLATMLSHKKRYNLDLRNALTVVNYLVDQHQRSKLTREQELFCAGKAINDCNEPQLDHEDIPLLNLVLGDVFGFRIQVDRQSALEATDTENNEEVEDPKDPKDPDSMEYKVGNVLNRLSLDLPMLKEKSIQAFELSGHRIGLTFLGTSFSGKTLCIRTLLEAMSVGETYSLRAVHINPVALGPRHLFGWYDMSTNEWTDGTFTSIWRRSARSESLKIWVVMDGPMNTTWIEYLNSIMDDSQMFTLPNGDRIPTKTGNKLVLEVDKLISASPATLSRTGVVYFPSSTVGYQALLGSWLAKRRTEESAAISLLFERFAEPVIEAVQKLPRFSSLPVNIAAQTNNFLSLLESFLADSVIAGELPARAVLERYLIVSLGWAFTGPMLFEDRKKMDNIFEGITSNLPTPANGYTLIDNILTDTAEGASQVWTSAHSLCKWEYPTIEDGDDYVTGRIPKFIVPTPRSVTTTYVTKWLVDPRICILVAGARGSGKSTICTAILKSMFSKNKLGEEKNKLTARVTLSFQTTNHQFQNMVERFLVRRQGNHYGPQPGTSLLCLIEDLNMPLKDQWKDEPCSEVLRSLLESGFVYSLQKPGDFKTLDDIKFIATANMHQEVDDLVSDRLRSRCLVAAIPEPDLEYMKSIFHPILEGRNRTYSAVGYEIKDMIARAFSGVIKLVLNLHQDLMVCRRLYHWSFTMHNVANLCQAFISLPPDSPEASNAQLLACFLFHECERELCDQLPEEEHAKFHKLLEDACKSSIKVDMKALRQSKFKFAKAIWTDLTEFPLANVAAERQNPTDALETNSSAASSPLGTAARGRVRPVESVANFLSRANNWLEEHNEKCEDSKAMNLVMFPNMISHLLRLVRILKNERGNAVLVGAPCTGKKSLVRLTAFVVEVQLITISSSQTANIKALQSTLRQGFIQAGLKQEQVIIAVSIDGRVRLETLDVIFCAVRNADTQLLMSRDDFDRILNSKEFENSIKSNLDFPKEAVELREIFRERVLQNIHFVLMCAMTLEELSRLPVQLPGECTIDLWLPYNMEDLEHIASHAVSVLEQRINQHTTMVMEKDTRQECLEDIQDLKRKAEEEENDDAFFSRTPSEEGFEEDNHESIVRDTIKVQLEFRDHIKERIRQVIPRLISESHIELCTLNAEFSARTGHGSYLSAASFRHYCRSFQDIFMAQFEKEYNRRKKLRIAIKTVTRCEADLAKAEQNFVEQRSLEKDDADRDYSTSIMATMKLQTAALEKLKQQLSSLTSDLIFAQDKIEDMQEEYDSAKQLVDSEQANIRRHLQFFTPDVVEDISRLAPVPIGIGLLMDVVLILLKQKLNHIQMMETNLRATIRDSWQHSINLLKRPSEFCQQLTDMNLDLITPEQLEIVQPYITSELLTAEKMQQVANGLAAPIVPWIHGVVNYVQIARSSLAVMEKFREITLEKMQLEERVTELAAVVKQGQEEVNGLRQQYDEEIHRKQSADETKEQQSVAIHTASDLIGGLRVRQARWSSQYSEYVHEVAKISGNSSIAAAFVTYCGLLDYDYRFKAEHDVMLKVCKNCSMTLNFPIDNLGLLSSDSEMATWRRQGLLPDDVCYENACLVKRSSSWPLIIDPYDDARTWITTHHKSNKEDIRFVHACEDKFMSQVQKCASFGIVLVIHGTDSDIQQDFGDLFNENFRINPAPLTINIGEESVEFNPSFQMYFMTSRKIPQYSSEFVARLSVVNFGSSVNVLELKMTGALLDLANREQALRRNELFQREIDTQVRIQQNANRLIDMLCEIEGNVVESIEVLNEIKGLRDEVGSIKKDQENMRKEREQMLKDIEKYTEVADHCRRLLESTFSISLLDPTYVMSIKMFLKTMAKTWHAIPIKIASSERTEYFVEKLRAEICPQVSAVLKPEHKLLWPLLLALQATGKKKDLLSNFDLQALTMTPAYVNTDGLGAESRTGDSMDVRTQRQQAMEFERVESRLKQYSWMNSQRIQGIFHLQQTWPVFGNDKLVMSMMTDSQEWAAFFTAPTPENEQIPHFDTRSHQDFTPYHRLLLMRFLLPDRFSAVVRKFVQQCLDPRLWQPAGMNIHEAFSKSDNQTPILILTCKNVNAASIIQDVAKTKIIKCQSIALGNTGSRELAQKMMLSGPGLGLWLLLENGHLDLSYLPTLPPAMEKMDFSDKNFRLFITADPVQSIPTNLLEISVRQYAEPAVGIKAKLIASLSWIEPETLEAVSITEWTSLLYSISFLHAWVLARSEFHQSGWNMPYEFHRTDILQCFDLVKSIIETNERKSLGMSRTEIPWTTVQQMFCEIILGSAVQLMCDKAILEAMIKRCISRRIYSGDVSYGIDFPTPYGDMQTIIKTLLVQTVNESAEVFGMDSVLSIDMEKARSEDVVGYLKTCLSIRKASETNQKLPTKFSGYERYILEVVANIQEHLPPDIALESKSGISSPLQGVSSGMQGRASFNPSAQPMKPMELFAASEHRQLHFLLETVRRDIRCLNRNFQAGLKMSGELETLAVSIQMGGTPESWMALSFVIPSLASWLEHLKESHSQVSMMVEDFKGSVSIGHCFSPAALARYYLQQVCAKHRWSHESCHVILKFGNADQSAIEKAKELVLTGLWLHGAAFDTRACRLLANPRNALSLVPLPPGRLVVERGSARNQTGEGENITFRAPLYTSKSVSSRTSIVDVHFLTDLPQQVLVLSSCAVYCLDEGVTT